MFEAKSIADSLGGTAFTLVGSDGGFRASLASELTRQGMQVAADVEPGLSNKFGLSAVNLRMGADNALQIRPEPGMAPANPVVSGQRLQPMQRQFS